MPTATKTPATTHASTTNPWSADLKDRLAHSQAATIFVPLEDDGEQPSDDELKTLAGDGLHVEYDIVRNALAVRAATPDEIAEATAPAEPAVTSSTSSSTSATSA